MECEAQLFEKCSKKGSDISEIARLLNQPGLDPNIYDEVEYPFIDFII